MSKIIEAKKNDFMPMSKALSGYIRKGRVVNFDNYEFIEKLALVQSTPRDKVLSRKIKNSEVKYLPYTYCQKVLNFLFGFKVGNKVVSTEWSEYIEEKKKWVWDKAQQKNIPTDKVEKIPVIECDLTVEFEFTYPDGSIIRRTVGGSHKQYKNKAVTRGMCKQAALSKSWTAVAGTFGIGKDLDGTEEDVLYDRMYQDDTIVEAESTVKEDSLSY